MPSPICVDASLVVKLVFPEEYADRARALWAEWDRQGVERFAPALWGYEVASVVRKYGYRGLLTPEEEDQALRLLLGLPVQLVDMSALHRHAWALARELGMPVTYDAHYLLLAQALGAEFWTGDRRLYNQVRGRLDYVRWLGELGSAT